VGERRPITVANRRPVAEARTSGSLILLLDYDGTLVPLARAPELAAPDAELGALLAELAGAPRTYVEIVSGRTRESLGGWFGHLPISPCRPNTDSGTAPPEQRRGRRRRPSRPAGSTA
jgi:trehalose 6-phosphate synthase/phosphatase